MADRKAETQAAARAAYARFRRSKATLDRVRDRLHVAIVDAVRAGNTKSQIARDTGYTREYVTELVKDADERDAANA